MLATSSASLGQGNSDFLASSESCPGVYPNLSVCNLLLQSNAVSPGHESRIGTRGIRA